MPDMARNWTPTPWAHPTTLPNIQSSEMPDMARNRTPTPHNTYSIAQQHKVHWGVRLGQEQDPNPLNTSYNTAQHTVFWDARHDQNQTPTPWTHPTTLPNKLCSEMSDTDPNPLNTSYNTAQHTVFWDARHDQNQTPNPITHPTTLPNIQCSEMPDMIRTRPQPPEHTLQHCPTYSVLRCQTWPGTGHQPPLAHHTALPNNIQCQRCQKPDPNPLNTSHNTAQHTVFWDARHDQNRIPIPWTHPTILPNMQRSEMPDMTRTRPQTPEHTLQHCPTYSVLRCQTWSEPDPNPLNTSYNTAQRAVFWDVRHDHAEPDPNPLNTEASETDWQQQQQHTWTHYYGVYLSQQPSEKLLVVLLLTK